MPEPVGIETVGGMAEKALPIIQSPIFMRVTLPGVLALVVLHPFLPFLAALTTIQPSFPWKSLAFAVGVAFVVGALASTLNGEIYKLYEGRNLWPKPLYAFCTARQQRRVEKLLGRAEKARIANDKHRRAELWYRLRRYPVDEKGKRCATRPTLLGDILAEYEEYPKSRYGMDSMFYWPRIWMTLDKEKKQEIEASW